VFPLDRLRGRVAWGNLTELFVVVVCYVCGGNKHGIRRGHEDRQTAYRVFP